MLLLVNHCFKKLHSLAATFQYERDVLSQTEHAVLARDFLTIDVFNEHL